MDFSLSSLANIAPAGAGLAAGNPSAAALGTAPAAAIAGNQSGSSDWKKQLAAQMLMSGMSQLASAQSQPIKAVAASNTPQYVPQAVGMVNPNTQR